MMMGTKQGLKRNLMMATAAIAICPTVSAYAAAADAGSAVKDTSGIEEIVVSGTKLQNMRSISLKRNTMQVVDAISADEIGRLPDFNVGESLARVPGISIRSDQGEARFVTIRGLNPDYNSTLMDGSAIAVPDRAGRDVFMEVLPASAGKQIEVFKTATPDLEGHAVGGVINIITPSAFDYKDMRLKVQAEIGQHQQHSGFEGSGLSGDADVMFANTFGPEKKFGIVLTGNYFKRNSYLPWAQFERYRFYDATTGAETSAYAPNSLAAPGQRRYHWYHNNRARYGGMAKFEYRPSSDFYNFLKVYYNKATDDEARQTDVFANNSGNTLVGGTATSGMLVGNNFHTRQYVGQFNFDRSLWGAQLGSDYHINADTFLKLRANYSAALFKNPESFVEWSRTSPDYAFSYKRDGDAFNVTLNDPAAAYNLNNMPMNNYNFTDRHMKETIYEVGADVVGQNLFSSNTLGYKIGTKFRNLKRSYNEDAFRYKAAAGNTFTLGSTGLATIADVPKMPGILPGQGVISVDTSKVLSSVYADIAANPSAWTYDEQTTNDLRADYGVTENVFAAYGAFTYEDDRQSLVAGVRLEATKESTSGNRAVDGIYGPVTDGSKYLNLLPSVNYTLRARPDLTIRTAYSRTIGRPAFTQFAPSRESVSTSGTQPTVSRSNPDLKPRVSDNVDLSVEKYLDNGAGIISVAGFYKRIDGEIFVRTTEQLVNIYGNDVMALVSQPENSADITNLWGVEVNVVKNFNFLPAPFDGFGASFNATRLWTDFKYQLADGTYFKPKTMLGQSNEMANVALFYDKDRISANLALNYTGMMMDRLNTNPDNISYVDKEWKVDFKAAYNVTENFQATLNLYNILGSQDNLRTGRYQEQIGRQSHYGRAIFFGFSFNY